MSDEGEEIVVTGYRLSGGGVTFSRSNSGDGMYETESELLPASEGETVGPPISIRVLIVNPANRERAEAAAKKLIEAIAQALHKLEAADPNKTFTFAGHTYRVGDVLTDLRNTDFTVTDRTDFDNNGVGQAKRGELGLRNSELVNMESITGAGGYASPNWPENAGMMALILHELGHISVSGDLLFYSSYGFWSREPADRRGANFYDTDYGRNLEAFANDFMNAAAAAIGVNLHGALPGGKSGAELATEIYDRHMASWQ